MLVVSTNRTTIIVYISRKKIEVKSRLSTLQAAKIRCKGQMRQEEKKEKREGKLIVNNNNYDEECLAACLR